MKDNRFNFTEKAIAALPIPTKEESPKTYYDSGSKNGLCLIVTYGGTKTYYMYTKFQGRPVRVKIEKSDYIKLIDARDAARTLQERASKGKDPSEKRKDALNDITLGQFYETQYLPRHSEVYKRPQSITNDNVIFKYHLKDFANRKMMNIKKEEIEQLHKKMKQDMSVYSANRMLSLIKHLYQKAIEWGYPERLGNPATNIHKFKEPSRERFLQSDEVKTFFDALKDEPNEVFKNYILLSIYTGQRRNSILTMKWRDVDLKNGFIYLPDTKNGEPQQVPLTTQAAELLKQMKKKATSEWVLPSKRGSSSGHLEDPKRPWQALLKRAGISDFRLHDLRRTQGSYQAILNIPLNVIGKSLGHKSLSATQGYAKLTADPVRSAMQKATDRMIELAKD